MNDEILKLAKECGYWSGQTVEMNEAGIEAFYRAAFNAGLEAGAKVCDDNERWINASHIGSLIRALEMRP